MATGVNVKLGVSGISQFKADIREAKDSIKTLDAQLALTEKQFKATGDQEEYLKQKTEQLQEKLAAQKSVAEGAQKALENMTNQGVDKSSKAFQDMIRTLANAKGDMIDTQEKLNAIGVNAEGAGDKTGDLNTQLQGIGKGVAWSNVAEGIEKITSKLESGARAAINFGKKIIQSAKGSTGLADDINTAVSTFSDMGLTADKYQRMTKVAEFVDTPVDAILNAQQRMNKALAGDKGKKSLEDVLGIQLQGQSPEDLFWEIGEALMNMGDAFDKEGAAQTMFGRSWRELVPLFKTGREEYDRMMEEQNVLTDDQLKKLNDADDAIKKVEQEIELLKAQFWAENADTITGVLEWIVDNKDGVVAAIGAIGVAFAGLKVVELAANMERLISGFNQLITMGGGGAGAAGAAGAAGGTGGGLLAGLAGKAAGVLPWLSTFLSYNGGPVYDWLTHESPLAGVLTGKETIGDFLSRTGKNIEENASTFEQDWANNGFTQLGKNNILYWDKIWKQQQNAGEWTFGDDMTAEELMALVTASEKMEEAAEVLTGEKETQQQSNSEMAAAAQGLQGLPAEMANAISQAMAGIGITIDGQMLIGYVNSALGNMVNP